MPSIRVVDESTAGDRQHESDLTIESLELTVEELIGLRVRQEVRRYRESTSSQDHPFYGLVRPAQMPESARARTIDADDQIAVALQAFREGRLLVLLADRQVERLDEGLNLREGDEVTFLRLVPLVGG